MKLMNEIESEASGRIVQVLVDNGQPWNTVRPSLWSNLCEAVSRYED